MRPHLVHHDLAKLKLLLVVLAVLVRDVGGAVVHQPARRAVSVLALERLVARDLRARTHAR
eukprot:5951299-Prymnesium_polylepis.1